MAVNSLQRFESRQQQLLGESPIEFRRNRISSKIELFPYYSMEYNRNYDAFQIYDNGVNPEKADPNTPGKTVRPSHPRSLI